MVLTLQCSRFGLFPARHRRDAGRHDVRTQPEAAAER